MAHISSLHEVARSRLHDLASKRCMPRGYDRALSRRTDVMAMQLPALLAARLANIPDVLMVRPDHARVQVLLHTAAQERLVKDMVARWVSLLEAEPKPDQQAACALATAHEQNAGASRLVSRLEAIANELDEAQVVIRHCQFDAALDLSEAREAVAQVLAQTKALQKKLDRCEEDLTEDLG